MQTQNQSWRFDLKFQETVVLFPCSFTIFSGFFMLFGKLKTILANFPQLSSIFPSMSTVNFANPSKAQWYFWFYWTFETYPFKLKASITFEQHTKLHTFPISVHNFSGCHLKAQIFYLVREFQVFINIHIFYPSSIIREYICFFPISKFYSAKRFWVSLNILVMRPNRWG